MLLLIKVVETFVPYVCTIAVRLVLLFVSHFVVYPFCFVLRKCLQQYVIIMLSHLYKNRNVTMLNYSIDYINMQLHLLCFVCRGRSRLKGQTGKGFQ